MKQKFAQKIIIKFANIFLLLPYEMEQPENLPRHYKRRGNFAFSFLKSQIAIETSHDILWQNLHGICFL